MPLRAAVSVVTLVNAVADGVVNARASLVSEFSSSVTDRGLQTKLNMEASWLKVAEEGIVFDLVALFIVTCSFLKELVYEARGRLESLVVLLFFCDLLF